MEYTLHVLVLIAIYALLASSLNLVAGLAGLVSVAQGAFFGIGAYAYALTAVDLGWPFWACVGAAMTAAAVTAAVLLGPCLRLRDEYVVLATFAFHMIVYSVLNNWTGLTRGPLGIVGIPPPELFGWRADSQIAILALAATILVASLLFLKRLADAPFGRVLRAIREDEVFAQSLGKNVAIHKARSLVLAAALAGLAGVIYASHATFIDPSSFTVNESLLIIAMVILGGRGTLAGPALGALLLVALPEALRFLGVSTVMAAQIRQVLYGFTLVAVMLWRPQGLLGERVFVKPGSAR